MKESTAVCLDNLKIISAFLKESIVPLVAKRPDTFNLKSYHTDENGQLNIPDVDEGDINACGTCSCAIGFTPHIPKFSPISKEVAISIHPAGDNFTFWLEYNKKILPGMLDVFGPPNAWSYMFSPKEDWLDESCTAEYSANSKVRKESDDDLQATIARIDEVIQWIETNGVIPEVDSQAEYWTLVAA